MSFAVNSCINHSFFTFILAVLLRFCSCSVTLFRVRSTWYGVRGPHHFWGAPVTQQPLPAKFGIKVVTATYYSSDCKNSLYYRTSRDQPYKLLSKLMSSALFRKIWCIYPYPVRSYWHFFISHNLKIQNGNSNKNLAIANRVWPRRNFVKVFDADKLEWLGYRMVKKTVTTC